MPNSLILQVIPAFLMLAFVLGMYWRAKELQKNKADPKKDVLTKVLLGFLCLSGIAFAFCATYFAGYSLIWVISTVVMAILIEIWVGFKYYIKSQKK